MMMTISNRSGCGARASQPHWTDTFGAPQSATDFGDVLVWPHDVDGQTGYVFLPTVPMMAEQAGAAPNMGLLETCGQAFFHAALQLGLHPERIEALRAELATQDVPVPHLTPAHLEVSSTEVVMIDAAGDARSLYQSTPAPHPPHAALVRAPVPDDAKPAVQAALCGAAGHIVLRFHVTHHVTTKTNVTAQGRFPSPMKDATLRRAIEWGEVVLTPPVDDPETRALVMAQIAAMDGIASGKSTITLSLSQTEPHQFCIEVDLGQMMAAHPSLDGS